LTQVFTLYPTKKFHFQSVDSRREQSDQMRTQDFLLDQANLARGQVVIVV